MAEGEGVGVGEVGTPAGATGVGPGDITAAGVGVSEGVATGLPRGVAVTPGVATGDSAGVGVGDGVNVGVVKEACASFNQKIRVIHEPNDNPAYTAIRNYKSDDLELLELLASDAWSDVVEAQPYL